MDHQSEYDFFLNLKNEKELLKSLIEATTKKLSGEIPEDKYLVILDIANHVNKTISDKRRVLNLIFKQISYHLVKMREWIEVSFNEGMDFVISFDKEYEDLYKQFSENNYMFLTEWYRHKSESGSWNPVKVLNETELIFKMINIISVEYRGKLTPDQNTKLVYQLSQQLIHLLGEASYMANSMDVRCIADRYYIETYLAGRYRPAGGGFQPDFQNNQMGRNSYYQAYGPTNTGLNSGNFGRNYR